MSTFSFPVRDLFIATGYATETTAKTFIDSASASEVAVLKKDGSAAASYGVDAYIIGKDGESRLKTSDNLKGGQVKSVTKVDPVTVVPANSSWVVDKTGVSTGDVYEGLVRISGYGSQSPYDEYLVPFSHVQVAADTNDTITQELIKSLSFNFSRVEGGNSTYVNNKTGYTAVYTTEVAALADKANVDNDDLIWVMENNLPYTILDDTAATFALLAAEKTDWSSEITAETAENQRGNPWFHLVKLDGATPTIYIIAKSQPTTDMKLQGYDINYKVGLNVLDGTTFDIDSNITVTNVAKVSSPGEGKFIRNLEVFAKGHTGDFYRGMGYPNNFDATYDADKSVNYYMVNVEFYQNVQDVNTLSGHPSQKVLQIACADSSTATSVYDALKALETAPVIP